jgi:hypothetical protein
VLNGNTKEASDKAMHLKKTGFSGVYNSEIKRPAF